MPLIHAGMIDGPHGPPPSWVICEPVPVVEPMTCRRGTGSRSTCQGQPIPTCDGVLKPAVIGESTKVLACTKCGLTHDKVLIGDVAHYGALL